MSNKNFPSEENEILTADDEKIRRMLGDLNHVDAPPNFDFRLKARIASHDPNDFKPRLFPVLRYLAPLGLALIVLAVLVAGSLYSTDNNPVPVVENPARNPIENVNLPGIRPSPETSVAEISQQPEKVENPPVNSVNSNRKDVPTHQKDEELALNPAKPKIDKPPTDDKGGSRDETGRIPKIILPPGFQSGNPIAVKDVLSTVGIEADFAKNQWKVRSVTENSRAANAGVKPGDIIESIDDAMLSGETIPGKNTFDGKLTIIRGGAKKELKL